uniref:Uncharacterized protein n=1 Tax=Cacopsylla melanoneura TaxID=428564 RepID=A0A8D8QCE8_9HEMI
MRVLRRQQMNPIATRVRRPQQRAVVDDPPGGIGSRVSWDGDECCCRRCNKTRIDRTPLPRPIAVRVVAIVRNRNEKLCQTLMSLVELMKQLQAMMMPLVERMKLNRLLTEEKRKMETGSSVVTRMKLEELNM